MTPLPSAAHQAPMRAFLTVAVLVGVIVITMLPLVSLLRERAIAGQRLIAALETATHRAAFPPITETPFIQHTLPPTWTPTDTPTASATFTPSATFTATATPTFTPTPTASITPTATITPTFTPSRVFSPMPTFAPPSGAPSPVAPIASATDDIFNILLIGSDLRPTDGSYRTDTLIVVSVNRTTRTLALLSIPRDLYVYIPHYGYDRINTAAERGDWLGWPGGGANLLLTTISYNLGLSIQRYASINFEGFKALITTLDGIDVPVDCPLTDYHLAAPGLTEGVPRNYAWYTLRSGIHHMDGAEALWYARSRETTSDFDRSRRQQVVLRAIWHQALDKHLIERLPSLWSQLTDIVATNLTLGDVLALLPLTTDLDATRLRSYAIGPAHTTPWTSPAGDEVLLPRADAIHDLLKRVYTPPTEKRLFAEQPSVAIVNGTTHTDWLALADAHLAWEGFAPLDPGDVKQLETPHMLLYDYTGGAKPESLAALTRIFRVSPTNIIRKPDPNRTADFQVVLGADYESCTFDPWESAPLTN